MSILSADPGFAELELASLSEGSDEASQIGSVFERLSSGHKIALLTLTRLVELVDERTLVLFDEPETHLHPPLLSSVVRALSRLLVTRNGVALIATHSPVVLQECPRSCVSVVRRSGREMLADRPAIETFGENVGVLTREAFGLEVTQSGFHQLLTESAETLDYDGVLAEFDQQIGAEGRAIVRSLRQQRSPSD
jgi:predicted ATPase